MEQFRYEKKFLAINSSYNEVNLMIKRHPYLFKKKYDERFVNNIYFDTLDYSLYSNHVDGKSHRYKIRVRWYNKLIEEIKKPVLEIKTKENYLGKKEYYSLDKIRLHENLTTDELDYLIKKKNIPEKVKVLNVKPVLINRYLRNYFESADKKYRITLDTNLSYYSFLHKSKLFEKIYQDKGLVIVELKYGIKENNYVSNISSYIPYRATKSSKYIRGIQITRDVVI